MDKNSTTNFMSPSTTSNYKGRLALKVILEILESYKEIFKEPEGLPHIRTHDHTILMKEGA
jgi:hypothetical protein